MSHGARPTNLLGIEDPHFYVVQFHARQLTIIATYEGVAILVLKLSINIFLQLICTQSVSRGTATVS